MVMPLEVSNLPYPLCCKLYTVLLNVVADAVTRCTANSCLATVAFEIPHHYLVYNTPKNLTLNLDRLHDMCVSFTCQVYHRD